MSEPPIDPMWIDDLVPPHGTVVGRFVSISYDTADENLTPDVQPLEGTIMLTPTTPAGRMDDVFARIRPVGLRVLGGQIVDDGEAPGVRILANDADLGVEDWAWKATFDFGDNLRLNPLTFKVATGETVNLTSGIVPVSSAPYQLVQGEAGESAYEVAVRGGYVGTEAEWLASLQGASGASTWDAITGKPTVFPPSAHSHEIADVNGLQAALDGAGGGGSVSTVDPYAANTARQTLMVQAMGGIVDTGGLGAVAIRIDHGWKNFKEKLLPIFRAANIVPMVTYNPRDWARTENDGVTTTEVNQWVADGWIEISNHGAVHQNATGAAEIDDFVGGSLAEIETQLPAAAGKVFGFCVPGVSSVEFPYDGFVDGGTAEMWDTAMGKTVLRYHAVGYGYMPGTHLRVLDGTIRQGQNHVTLDAGNVTSAKSYIDQAATQRRGLQMMLHPSLVDTAGKITTAQVQEIVDYIVAKRTAGELLALTSYQMMVADSSRVATSGAVELRDTGWQAFIPGGPAVDPAEPGVVELRRIEDQVFCRLVGVAILPGASNDWLMPNGLPVGYSLGSVGMVVDVQGGYSTVAQANRAVRHRIAVIENDIAYVGYIHNWSGVTVEAARADGTRRIYGNVPSWVTDDPFPT